MSTLAGLLRSAEHTALLIQQLVCFARTFLGALFLPKTALAARLLAAESQLAAYAASHSPAKEAKAQVYPGVPVPLGRTVEILGRVD